MARMTKKAIEIRGRVLADAVERYGQETVEAWADDPAKVRILNALAQLEADEPATGATEHE